MCIRDRSSAERGLPFDMEVAYGDLRSAGSFGGLNKLRRYAGATTRSAREFLAKRDSYTLHEPRKLRFPRRKTYSKGIADLYQINLVDVSGLSSHNDGSRYLLTCIDVFSKRAWAVRFGGRQVKTLRKHSKKYWPTEIATWCRATRVPNF